MLIIFFAVPFVSDNGIGRFLCAKKVNERLKNPGGGSGVPGEFWGFATTNSTPRNKSQKYGARRPLSYGTYIIYALWRHHWPPCGGSFKL